MWYDYFVAADDETAARELENPDTARSAGYPELVAKGVDPELDLLPVEAVLTGRTTDEVQNDPAHCPLVAQVDEGEVVILSLADSFRDALAAADVGALHAAAVAFVEVNEAGEVEEVAGFLTELAVLAKGAVENGHRLYCEIAC
ncbi:hypothetical protein [Amycolatopsis jejuensis]|uniref:hypothetical protein n=1 Tax=Amycolatopsis jejuensis TaxID=330084 RepID=UPI0005244279|nr:hypothetical protein [Amycolatopsis jejuensis]